MAYWKAKNSPAKHTTKKTHFHGKDGEVVDERSFSEKLETGDITLVDNRSEEEKKKEQEEIAKEEELKRKEQEKIQQQVEGTYVETEEDAEKRKEKWNNLQKK